MKKSGIVLLACVLLNGCTRIEYLDYKGSQDWPTGAAFVKTLDGMEVYEGLPPCAYEVVGLIDVYDEKPFYLDNTAKNKVIELAKDHKADAILWLSDRTVSTGYMKMKQQKTEPTSVDTGRSSQPEIIISNVSQSTITSYKKSLRHSLLLIRWKK